MIDMAEAMPAPTDAEVIAVNQDGDRQVLLCLIRDEEGWEIIEDACARFDKGDPVRFALSAIARQLVQTSATR